MASPMNFSWLYAKSANVTKGFLFCVIGHSNPAHEPPTGEAANKSHDAMRWPDPTGDAAQTHKRGNDGQARADSHANCFRKRLTGGKTGENQQQAKHCGPPVAPGAVKLALVLHDLPTLGASQ